MSKKTPPAVDTSKAARQEPAQALRPAEVLMEKDGVKTEVRNNESVQIMEAAGWKLVA